MSQISSSPVMPNKKPFLRLPADPGHKPAGVGKDNNGELAESDDDDDDPDAITIIPDDRATKPTRVGTWQRSTRRLANCSHGCGQRANTKTRRLC